MEMKRRINTEKEEEEEQEEKLPDTGDHRQRS